MFRSKIPLRAPEKLPPAACRRKAKVPLRSMGVAARSVTLAGFLAPPVIFPSVACPVPSEGISPRNTPRGLSRRRGFPARRLSTSGSLTRCCEDRLEAPGFEDQLARGFDSQVIGLHQRQQHSAHALGMSRHCADVHHKLFRRFADARGAIPDVNRSCRRGNLPTQLPGSWVLWQFLANRCRRPGESFCTLPEDPLSERHGDWT
jgi:hypothetical protein